MFYNPKTVYNGITKGLTKAYTATGTRLEKLLEFNDKGFDKFSLIGYKTLDSLTKVYKTTGLEKFMKITEKKLGELDSQSRALVTTFYLAGTGYAGWGIHSIAEGELFEGSFLTGFGLVLYGAGVMQHKISNKLNQIGKALDKRNQTLNPQQDNELNITPSQ